MYTIRSIILLLWCTFQVFCAPTSVKDDNTLVLVHALFRHGDRTTDTYTIYDNDPYINETYYPFGQGQLTNIGKQREYNLGLILRNRYNDFLGDVYVPDIVEARSTDVNRTKMSLELVLAGLFPPKGEQVWQNQLLWQPIPFNYVTNEEDTLLFSRVACPNFRKLYEDYYATPEMVKEMEQYQTLFKFVAENSGLEVKNYEPLMYLYFCLTTEREFGLLIPEWAFSCYSNLEKLATQEYIAATGTVELKQILAGALLQKIITDSAAKIAGNSELEERKIFLYSAHEMNIAYMLRALDVFEPHIPPYGSCIIFEIHNIDGEFGIKIFYENYSQSDPILLKLPNCDEFCKFDDFVSLTKPLMPTEGVCGN